MITTSTLMNALRFPKRLMAATTLVFAFGLASAQADFLLSDAQAKLAAAEIKVAANPLNAAVTVAQSFTLNSGAQFAAVNAEKIVKFLPANLQALVGGRVGVGVALNYPNQLPAITLAIASRDPNPALVAYQLTLAGGFDQATQIAWEMAVMLRNDKDRAARAALISQVMIAAICNRTDIPVMDRVNEMATIAAILSIRSAKPGKLGQISKESKDALALVEANLATTLKNVTAGAPNADALIYNGLATYFLNLKNALLASGVSGTALNTILLQAAARFQLYLPAGLIGQAVNNVIAGNTSTIVDTSHVVHPETPAVDGGRRP